MKKARIIKENKKYQYIEIPKEFHIDANEVTIEKVGDVLMLKPNKLTNFEKALTMFSDDYMSEGRKQ